MIQSTYSHPYWEVRNYIYGWVCAKIDQGRMVESYPFETYEWAMLCKQSMDRHDKFLHDRKWGGSTASIVWNHQGQLTFRVLRRDTCGAIAGMASLGLDAT